MKFHPGRLDELELHTHRVYGSTDCIIALLYSLTHTSFGAAVTSPYQSDWQLFAHTTFCHTSRPFASRRQHPTVLWYMIGWWTGLDCTVLPRQTINRYGWSGCDCLRASVLKLELAPVRSFQSFRIQTVEYTRQEREESGQNVLVTIFSDRRRAF